MTKTLALVLLAALAVPAQASDCPPPYKPKPAKKAKHKPKAKPPASYCKVLVGPPGTPGAKGDHGPAGPKGTPGERGPRGAEGTSINARFPLALGVFGTYMGRHGDWAWGPALLVSGKASENYDLSLMGGLAMGASEDRESGYTVRLGLGRDVTNTAQLEAGLGVLHINGSTGNANISGDYVTLDLGVALTHHIGPVKLQARLIPIMLGVQNDTLSDNKLSFGSSANLFGSVGW